MKIIVDSFDRFGELAEFDSETSELVPHPEWERDSQYWQHRVGFYSVLSDGVAALFRMHNELFLWARGHLYPISDDIVGKVEGKGRNWRSTLVGKSGPVASIDYCPQGPQIPPELDFTAARPEDFDFFLFLTGLLQDPRRRRLAKGLPGS